MVALFTDNGWVIADYGVTIIALIAAVLSMGVMTGWPRSLKQAGMWLVSIGWLMILWRFAVFFVEDLDPKLSTIGQVALALLGTGMVLYLLGDRKK